MRNRLTTHLLTACIGITLASSAAAEKLDDVVRETIATNPDVLISQDQRNAVEQEMEQARAGFFPQADITIGGGWERSNNETTRARDGGKTTKNRNEAELMVRQLLYDGSLTENEVDRQKARVNSRAYSTFGTSEITGLRAVDAFFTVLKEEEVVKLSEVNLKTHQENYRRILKRGERGVGRKSDTQQALGRLALAETNLISAQNNLIDAKAAFENIVGRPPGTLEIPESIEYLLPANMDEALQQALDNHPTLKSAHADVEAARKQEDAAKSLFFPRVHLEASGSNNDNIDGIQGKNHDRMLMLRGRYSMTGGKDLARRRETAYLLNEAKEIRDRTRRQVIESIQLSWHAYIKSKKSLESLKVHVDASRQARDAYRKQFNIGQRSLLDLLDSDNELYLSQIAYVDGRKEYLYSMYRILAGTGKLLWTLQVPVPEEATTIR